MKQFDEGLFVGTVQSYDRKTDLYKILYSDGDGEDMDEQEYVYAYQLAMAKRPFFARLSRRGVCVSTPQTGLIADNEFPFFKSFASLSHCPFHIQAKPQRKPRKIRRQQPSQANLSLRS
jgi:hypothetical protein